MFTINNVKTFKDSVHGYIDVPKCFVRTLIDNDYFQRLRNVEQTGMRVLYPNAKHDRFSHSLGVFYLGNRAVDALLDNFSKDQYWNIESDSQSVLYWAKNKVLFLIACLLHDIGHAPFSHALESQILYNSDTQHKLDKKKKADSKSENSNCITEFLQETIFEKEKEYMKLRYDEDIEENNFDVTKVAPHERIGARMIFDDFFKNQIIKIFDSLHDDGFPCPETESILYSEYYQDKIVIDKIDKKDKKSMVVFDDDICFIARMIMGLKYDDWRPERQIRNCFIELLNGENFDVDKLDYIVRDTQMSGINNISLDVDRLVNSLYIITKTKHLKKIALEKNNLGKMTIISIKNCDVNNTLDIDGNFHGTLIIEKGTKVLIRKNSKIESFTNIYDGEVRIHYKDGRRTTFNPEAIITQESELVLSADSGSGNKIITLLGKNGTTQFNTTIKNAILLEDFHFIADENIKLKIHENCNMKIEGLFYSKTSVRLFNINKLSGDVSEVEVLADTFRYDFTNVKVPGKYGYNTFAIGFKKQAINVIANVIDARNYLYLWIYAHHKVIYYANFLVPVLAKELFPKEEKTEFPDLRLNFKNICFLDDAYIWTTIRYKLQRNNWKKDNKHKEVKGLIDELFTRKYKKSLYKSLAEYDLFFEKYNQNTMKKIQEYINVHLIDGTKTSKPYIENEKDTKRRFSAGYFKKEQITIINKFLKSIIEDDSKLDNKFENLQLLDLVYVVADYKRKQLETAKTFIDMKDDVIPISQIQLLEAQTKNSVSTNSTYFYLYYKTTCDLDNEDKDISECIKKAVKQYFEYIVTSKIN